MSDYTLGMLVGAAIMIASVAGGVMSRLAFDAVMERLATRRARRRGGW